MARGRLLDFTAIRRDTSFDVVLAHYNLSPAKPADKIKLNCPFHDDDDPSLSITVSKGVYNCFGCPAGGNVLDFISEMEEYGENGTLKAAKKAIEIIGADPAKYHKNGNGRARNSASQERRSGDNKEKTAQSKAQTENRSDSGSDGAGEDEEKRTSNPVLDLQLKLDPEHQYLVDRGIDRALAEKFEMGYCKAGIMKKRIALPIHNFEGELVAYIGRWAAGDDSIPEKEGKYKLPNNFEKSLEVFNLHRAVYFALPYVVIVEGIWSTIRLHAAGIPTVALLGTSCTEIQAEQIAKAGFKHAILILDGDDAGRSARPSVLEVLSQHVYVKSIDLPEGIKPDTMDEEIVNRLRR